MFGWRIPIVKINYVIDVEDSRSFDMFVVLSFLRLLCTKKRGADKKKRRNESVF